MRILLASPGDPYSMVNFRDQFRAMGHEVTHWDFTKESHLPGYLKPHDLLFHVLVMDELPPHVLLQLAVAYPRMKSLQFACDDEWRLPVATQNAGLYTYCTTNDPWAVPLYRAKGFDNVRHVQYGVNLDAWQRQPFDWTDQDTATYDADYLRYPFDVSFVGQAYVGRPEFIAGLLDRGIRVNAFGQGFPGGAVSQDRMIQILCSSKIVLGLNWVAGGPHAGYGPQIKGRQFEAAAMGCFQLVSYDRRLPKYFSNIASFTSLDDCAEKIHYYLVNPEEREAMAKAGQAQAIRSHSWPRRWAEAVPELFGAREEDYA